MRLRPPPNRGERRPPLPLSQGSIHLIQKGGQILAEQLQRGHLPAAPLEGIIIQVLHADGEVDAYVAGDLVQPPALLRCEVATAHAAAHALRLQLLLVASLHPFRVGRQLLVQGGVAHQRDQVGQDAPLARPAHPVLLQLGVGAP